MARKKQTKHPDPPISLTRQATEIAKLQLENLLKQSPDLVWLHDKYEKISYDQLNFIYKNQNFSVIIDIQDKDGNSYTSEDFLNRQNFAVENFGVIPCKFPVVVDDVFGILTKNIKPKSDGWNLYHTKTGDPIIPTELVSDEKVELSDFELLNYCVRFVALFLKSKGCNVTYYQDTLEVSPQICFIEPDRTRSWVLVRCRRDKDEKIDYKKAYKDILKDGINKNGYYAELEVLSPQGEGEKLYRGDDARVRFIKFEQIRSMAKIDNVTQNDILKENIYDLVIKTMSIPQLYKNQRTHIYPLLHYKEWLLKMGKKHFSKPDKILKKLVLVPIRYENNLEDNTRFGLPVYIIDKKSSENVKRGYITPQKAISFNHDYMTIIRRIYGEEVNSIYSKPYKMMIGVDEKDVLFSQSKLIYDISQKYGDEIAIKALEYCKQGIHDIKKDELTKGSPTYRFMNEKDYYISYMFFIKHFLYSLKLFSELPQETYDNAVSDIMSAKGFAFDFTHPKNTYINFDTKEFMFIDVFFDDEHIEKYKDKNPLEQFRDVILGYNHNNEFHPKDFVFYPKDKELFNQYTKTITEKINKTAPKKYKLLSDY